MTVEINNKTYENVNYGDSLFNILSENLEIGKNYDFLCDNQHLSHIIDYKGVELERTVYDCETFKPIQPVIIKYENQRRMIRETFNHIKIFEKNE